MICLEVGVSFENGSLQSEYLSRHPTGVNPVQLNDVFFAVHAMFACAITILQCFLYEVQLQRLIINILISITVISARTATRVSDLPRPPRGYFRLARSLHRLVLAGGAGMARLRLHLLLHQAWHYPGQVRAAGLYEL